jgi:hypothetical protein
MRILETAVLITDAVELKRVSNMLTKARIPHTLQADSLEIPLPLNEAFKAITKLGFKKDPNHPVFDYKNSTMPSLLLMRTWSGSTEVSLLSPKKATKLDPDTKQMQLFFKYGCNSANDAQSKKEGGTAKTIYAALVRVGKKYGYTGRLFRGVNLTTKQLNELKTTGRTTGGEFLPSADVSHWSPDKQHAKAFGKTLLVIDKVPASCVLINLEAYVKANYKDLKGYADTVAGEWEPEVLLKEPLPKGLVTVMNSNKRR